MNEIADARAATDEVMRAQASADMSNKKMLETLNAINKKVDDANLTLGDFASNMNKISCENSDLLRIVGDLDNNLNILAKQKAALAAQLNDVKALCDNEARERGLLPGCPAQRCQGSMRQRGPREGSAPWLPSSTMSRL